MVDSIHFVQNCLVYPVAFATSVANALCLKHELLSPAILALILIVKIFLIEFEYSILKKKKKKC